MDSNASTDGFKNCPYCGAQVSEKAIYCNSCKTNLLAKFTDLKRDLAAPPPLGATIAAGAALLLLLFLGAMLVLAVQSSFAYGIYVYLGVITVLLAVAAARGRYDSPGVAQYLLSFLIVFIPLIGTLYGVFYAARSLARARGPRLALYATLMGMLVVTIFVYGKPQNIFAVVPISASGKIDPVEAVPVTATERPEPTQTLEPTYTATAKPTRVTPEPEQAVLPNCTPWSEITLEQVGEEACVYGEYLEIFQKKDETYVMSFSEEPGTFQIWSYPKPMEMFLPEDNNGCVMVKGWIKTSGVRPIIILLNIHTLENCN